MTSREDAVTREDGRVHVDELVPSTAAAANGSSGPHQSLNPADYTDSIHPGNLLDPSGKSGEEAEGISEGQGHSSDSQAPSSQPSASCTVEASHDRGSRGTTSSGSGAKSDAEAHLPPPSGPGARPPNLLTPNPANPLPFQGPILVMKPGAQRILPRYDSSLIAAQAQATVRAITELKQTQKKTLAAAAASGELSALAPSASLSPIGSTCPSPSPQPGSSNPPPLPGLIRPQGAPRLVQMGPRGKTQSAPLVIQANSGGQALNTAASAPIAPPPPPPPRSSGTSLSGPLTLGPKPANPLPIQLQTGPPSASSAPTMSMAQCMQNFGASPAGPSSQAQAQAQAQAHNNAALNQLAVLQYARIQAQAAQAQLQAAQLSGLGLPNPGASLYGGGLVGSLNVNAGLNQSLVQDSLAALAGSNLLSQMDYGSLYGATGNFGGAVNPSMGGPLMNHPSLMGSASAPLNTSSLFSSPLNPPAPGASAPLQTSNSAAAAQRPFLPGPATTSAPASSLGLTPAGPGAAHKPQQITLSTRTLSNRLGSLNPGGVAPPPPLLGDAPPVTSADEVESLINYYQLLQLASMQAGDVGDQGRGSGVGDGTL